MPWNPQLYNQFEKERSAPFDDLLGLVNRREGLTVIDLGCGTGELTGLLADALPGSDVLGVDSSPEMLAEASTRARSGLRFESSKIEDISGKWDLVFSNAALQWVDDHVSLIPRLFQLLRAGGQLVVQIPSNHNSFTHTAIRQVAAESPFREALGGWNRQSPALTLDSYADLLYTAGGHDLTVIEKVYPHILEDADAVQKWTRGTTLIPYLERLPEALKPAFLDRYMERLRGRWPNGPVFFGFRRILFAASN